ILRADPIGAKRTLDEASGRQSAVAVRAKSVLDGWKEGEAAQEKLRAAAERAAQERAGGLLLTGEEAHPDPLVARAPAHPQTALELLQTGDFEKAGEHVKRMFLAAEEIVARIEAQRQARTAVAEGIPARRKEAAKAAEQVRLAQEATAELARDFDQASWHDV